MSSGTQSTPLRSRGSDDVFWWVCYATVRWFWVVSQLCLKELVHGTSHCLSVDKKGKKYVNDDRLKAVISSLPVFVLTKTHVCLRVCRLL